MQGPTKCFVKKWVIRIYGETAAFGRREIVISWLYDFSRFFHCRVVFFFFNKLETRYYFQCFLRRKKCHYCGQHLFKRSNFFFIVSGLCSYFQIISTYSVSCIVQGTKNIIVTVPHLMQSSERNSVWVNSLTNYNRDKSYNKNTDAVKAYTTMET